MTAESSKRAERSDAEHDLDDGSISLSFHLPGDEIIRLRFDAGNAARLAAVILHYQRRHDRLKAIAENQGLGPAIQFRPKEYYSNLPPPESPECGEAIRCSLL